MTNQDIKTLLHYSGRHKRIPRSEFKLLQSAYVCLSDAYLLNGGMLITHESLKKFLRGESKKLTKRFLGGSSISDYREREYTTSFEHYGSLVSIEGEKVYTSLLLHAYYSKEPLNSYDINVWKNIEAQKAHRNFVKDANSTRIYKALYIKPFIVVDDTHMIHESYLGKLIYPDKVKEKIPIHNSHLSSYIPYYSPFYVDKVFKGKNIHIGCKYITPKRFVHQVLDVVKSKDNSIRLIEYKKPLFSSIFNM